MRSGISQSDGSTVQIDFIVGMSRSGTTWLGRVLSAHPDIAVIGETSFWGNCYVPPRPDGLYGAQELTKVLEIQRTRDWRSTTQDDRHILTSAGTHDYRRLVEDAIARVQPPVHPSIVFRALALTVAEREGKSHVVEKTPHHIHWLPRIVAAFPQSKFLVTERDPYEFVISLGHLGNRIDRRLARALDRPWRHPLLSALAWRGYINSIEKARIDYPDRILVIRTSDLRERSEVAVADAQRFLGVPVCELPVGLPPLNSSFSGGRRPEPSGDEVFWTNVVARDAMLRNGYLPRRTPIAPSQLFTSFLELPVSLAISCARLPWKTRGSRRDYLSLWLRRPSAAGTSKG